MAPGEFSRLRRFDPLLSREITVSLKLRNPSCPTFLESALRLASTRRMVNRFVLKFGEPRAPNQVRGIVASRVLVLHCYPQLAAAFFLSMRLSTSPLTMIFSYLIATYYQFHVELAKFTQLGHFT
jgi:hypothetical protein